MTRAAGKAPVVGDPPRNSLAWVSELLEAKESSRESFALMTGRAVLNPRIKIAMEHRDWGNCVVTVAEGESADFLRNEVWAIEKCTALDPEFNVPRILHWVDGGNWAAVVTPWYSQGRQLSLEAVAGLLAPIHLAAGAQVRLRDTPVLDGIQTWYHDLGKQDAGVEKVLRMGSRLDTPVLASLAHRDFWWKNVLADGDRPIIIDWEHSAAAYPVLFDLFQYYVLSAPTSAAQLARLLKLIESPRVAIPVNLEPEALESLETRPFRILVGVWLADFLGIRVQAAIHSGTTDPYNLQAWDRLAVWNSALEE